MRLREGCPAHAAALVAALIAVLQPSAAAAASAPELPASAPALLASTASADALSAIEIDLVLHAAPLDEVLAGLNAALCRRGRANLDVSIPYETSVFWDGITVPARGAAAPSTRSVADVLDAIATARGWRWHAEPRDGTFQVVFSRPLTARLRSEAFAGLRAPSTTAGNAAAATGTGPTPMQRRAMLRRLVDGSDPAQIAAVLALGGEADLITETWNEFASWLRILPPTPLLPGAPDPLLGQRPSATQAELIAAAIARARAACALNPVRSRAQSDAVTATLWRLLALAGAGASADAGPLPREDADAIVAWLHEQAPVLDGLLGNPTTLWQGSRGERMAAAIRACGSATLRGSIPVLRRVLLHTAPSCLPFRLLALTALADIGSDDALAAIAAARSDPALRNHAALCLARCRNPAAAHHLMAWWQACAQQLNAHTRSQHPHIPARLVEASLEEADALLSALRDAPRRDCDPALLAEALVADHSMAETIAVLLADPRLAAAGTTRLRLRALITTLRFHVQTGGPVDDNALAALRNLLGASASSALCDDARLVRAGLSILIAADPRQADLLRAPARGPALGARAATAAASGPVATADIATWCLALAEARTQDAVGLLSAWASHADPAWRTAVAAAVPMSHDPALLAVLDRLANDDDASVRRAALHAAGSIAHTRMIPLLVRSGDDADPHVRRAGLLALAHIPPGQGERTRSSRTFIERLLQHDQDPDVRRDAALLIARHADHGDVHAIALLREAIARNDANAPILRNTLDAALIRAGLAPAPTPAPPATRPVAPSPAAPPTAADPVEGF